jgi:hypothetical protein
MQQRPNSIKNAIKILIFLTTAALADTTASSDRKTVPLMAHRQSGTRASAVDR